MNWIMNQVAIKFGGLKIDNGGDTNWHSDATYYQTTYGKIEQIFMVLNDQIIFIVAQFFFQMPETLLSTNFLFMLQEVTHCIHLQCLFWCDTGWNTSSINKITFFLSWVFFSWKKGSRKYYYHCTWYSEWLSLAVPAG